MDLQGLKREQVTCGMCRKVNVPQCGEGYNFLCWDEADDASICDQFEWDFVKNPKEQGE